MIGRWSQSPTRARGCQPRSPSTGRRVSLRRRRYPRCRARKRTARFPPRRSRPGRRPRDHRRRHRPLRPFRRGKPPPPDPAPTVRTRRAAPRRSPQPISRRRGESSPHQSKGFAVETVAEESAATRGEFSRGTTRRKTVTSNSPTRIWPCSVLTGSGSLTTARWRACQFELEEFMIRRSSFRHRVVACVAVGLTFHVALAPVALASTMPGFGADRSLPAGKAPAVGTSPDRAPSATATGSPRTDSPARPDDSVPELWTPRTAQLVDTNQPLGAESLFDGDATTGFTTAGGRSRLCSPGARLGARGARPRRSRQRAARRSRSTPKMTGRAHA